MRFFVLVLLTAANLIAFEVPFSCTSILNVAVDLIRHLDIYIV